MHRLDTFPNIEMIQAYRHVFSAPGAIEVLAHMLYEFGTFLDVANTPEDVALKNYGMRFLSILGGGEVNSASMEALIKQLMKQPLPEEGRNKD